MTQVSVNDSQALPAFIGLPLQRPAPTWGHEPDLAPAMTAGKGVRTVQCAGCRRETLPRTDDGAPLCSRCSEVLAESGSATRRWWRRS